MRKPSKTADRVLALLLLASLLLIVGTALWLWYAWKVLT
jgi:hypothetical protein